MQPWWGRYVGIPFVDRGFDRTGCHCWGLVWLVYREQLSIELPQAGEVSHVDLLAAARALRELADDPWHPVTAPRAYDVVLMQALTNGNGSRQHSVPSHVGVMVDDDQVLHVWQATGALVMRRDRLLLRHNIVSFHRHARFV